MEIGPSEAEDGSKSRNSLCFVEAEVALPYSQEPATCPYSETDESKLCPSIPFLQHLF
jgi:hypothetical protein